MHEFLSILETAVSSGDCLSLVLSKRRAGVDDLPEKLTARPVRVGDTDVYQFAARRNGQETHENLPASAAGKRAVELFSSSFAHCHLYTSAADYSARSTTTGKIRFSKSAPSRTSVQSTHNRTKQYLIPDGEPCPFLAEVGIMTSAGRVRQARYHKFRQINRYLELVNDIYDQLPAEGTLNVVDFGCGKSYLTFALHHLLTNIHQRTVNLVGLDRNASVIRDCQRIAEQLHCSGLTFSQGDIASHATDERVHLAVSLHACDTATDDALAQAIRWQADVILAVPCCQHELAKKLKSKPLEGILRHGILTDRFAAVTTDALRAAALEVCGYRTQVVEFIDMEHTAKNILLRAVRGESDESRRNCFIQEYRSLKQATGLDSIYLDRVVEQAEVI